MCVRVCNGTNQPNSKNVSKNHAICHHRVCVLYLLEVEEPLLEDGLRRPSLLVEGQHLLQVRLACHASACWCRGDEVQERERSDGAIQKSPFL